MRAQNSRRSGFTLVELLVSLTVLVILFGLGFIVDNRSYHRASVESERDAIVGLLSRARNQAMNNIDQANHGFAVTSSTYVIYEGNSYSLRTISLDETFPRTGGIAVSGISDMTFEALDGVPSATGTITVTGPERSAVITITKEGMIDW